MMLESLLNYRFLGTTLSYKESLIALENITIDKVTTYSVSKVKKIDTTMEISMAARIDGEEAFEKGHGKACELAMQVVYRRTGAVGKTGHIAANCTKGSRNRSLNAVEEDKGDISEDVQEDED